jgi:D-alanyl-D-alanine carboxypeptidase
MHSRLIAIADELGISSTSLASRNLRECEEAECLEVAETGVDGKDHLLVSSAAGAWRSLQAAAVRDGVSLFIVSAFRSIERQVEIVRRKLDAGATIEEILTACAPPGFSEHHTGRAVDVSTPGTPSLEVEFGQTPAFSWLVNHANNFGFYLSYPIGNPEGYRYEPWHWCFHDTPPIIPPDLSRQAAPVR